MLVRATRTLSTWVLRALFYVALFLVVVVVHIALTTALRQHGWTGGLSLLASGAAVLLIVLALLQGGDWLRRGLRQRTERERMKLKLPSGPMCVVWPPTPEAAGGASMPWVVVGSMRARYPRLPRRLQIEGFAIAEFEVSAGGRAKNIHLVDAWPSDVFFAAAKEALEHARFQPGLDEHVRYGASYRMPFVFRLNGITQLPETGERAKTLRPILHAVQHFLETLAAESAEARARGR